MIQSKELAVVFSTMANTRENLKETIYIARKNEWAKRMSLFVFLYKQSLEHEWIISP